MIEFIWNNLYLLGAVGVSILLATLLSEYFSRMKSTSDFINRKLLHIIAVGLCTFTIYATDADIYLGYIFIFFSVPLAMLVLMGRFSISKNGSLGIALFPLAFGLEILFRWNVEIIVVSGLVLTISDSIAGVVGYYFGTKPLPYLQEHKTLLGSFAFLTLTLLLLLLQNFIPLSFNQVMVLSITATFSEMISYRGSDNLSIPLVVGYIMQHYML